MSSADATRLTVVLIGSHQHDPEHEPLEDELYIEVATPQQVSVLHFALLQGMELIQRSGDLENSDE